MTLIKLKEKGQLTIPAPLREKLASHVGDLFLAEIVDGKLVLTPQVVVSRSQSEPAAVDIAPWIGAGKGMFSSVEEIDAYIASERASWD